MKDRRKQHDERETSRGINSDVSGTFSTPALNTALSIRGGDHGDNRFWDTACLRDRPSLKRFRQFHRNKERRACVGTPCGMAKAVVDRATSRGDGGMTTTMPGVAPIRRPAHVVRHSLGWISETRCQTRHKRRQEGGKKSAATLTAAQRSARARRAATTRWKKKEAE